MVTQYIFLYFETKSLHEKCPYREFFWSIFCGLNTEKYRVIRMWEDLDQKNSEYGHFSRCESFKFRGMFALVNINSDNNILFQ